MLGASRLVPKWSPEGIQEIAQYCSVELYLIRDKVDAFQTWTGDYSIFYKIPPLTHFSSFVF
jgi:hypothetical protein